MVIEILNEYDSELVVDKSSINAHDYALIKNPVNKPSKIPVSKKHAGLPVLGSNLHSKQSYVVILII